MRQVQRAMAVFVVLVVSLVVADACSWIANAKIWSKNPRSNVPLFRVVVQGKAGYINRAGEIVIAPEFHPNTYSDSSSGDFIDGTAEVTSSAGGEIKSWLLYSDRRREVRNGQLVRAHEGLKVFFGPPLLDSQKRPKFLGPRGYQNERGDVAIAAKYAYAGKFSEGLAAVALDGPCWVEGASGAQPAPSAEQVFTSCGPMPAKSVTQPCRHGYIDRTGAMVIPAEFELARDFHEGRAAVRRDEKWGFIDRGGRLAVKYLYDEVTEFSEGFAAVRRGTRWGFVGLEGAEMDLHFHTYYGALPFGSGLAPVKNHAAWLYINRSGDVKIAGPFLQATQFVQGLAHVQTAKTKWAWIDPQGKRVFEYEWDEGKYYTTPK